MHKKCGNSSPVCIPDLLHSRPIDDGYFCPLGLLILNLRAIHLLSFPCKERGRSRTSRILGVQSSFQLVQIADGEPLLRGCLYNQD